MKLLFKLLKVDLLNTLTLNQFRSTKKYKAKSVKPLVGSIIILVISAALFVFYGVFLSVMAHEAGKDASAISISVGLGAFMTLFMTFGRAYTSLFKGKDFELLSSMPIPTRTIVASKILSLVIVNYLYFSFIFVSSFGVYLFFTGISLYKILVGLLYLIVGPFFPTVFCTGISFLFGLMLSKAKHKNILQTISSVLMFVLLFIAIYSLELGAINGGEEYFAKLVDTIDGVMTKAYFMSVFAANGMEGNILHVLWFFLISVVPFVLFVLLIAKNFVRLNTSGNGGYKNKNFKLDEELKKEKKPNQVRRLLYKEAKTFFSTSIYCLNVLIGPILACVLSVGMYVTISSSTGGEPIGYLIATVILIFTTNMAVGMAPSTACSISMEGHSFWIIKTAPIKTEKVFIAKVLLYILMCIPFILITGGIALLLWKVRIIDAIFLVVIATLGASTMAMLGLWVNTCKYRFDWTNPAQVVKQSSDTLLAMLLSFAFDIVLVVPGFLLMQIMYSPIIMLAVAILTCSLSALLLFTNGKKRYEAIQY